MRERGWPGKPARLPPWSFPQQGGWPARGGGAERATNTSLRASLDVTEVGKTDVTTAEFRSGVQKLIVTLTRYTTQKTAPTAVPIMAAPG